MDYSITRDADVGSEVSRRGVRNAVWLKVRIAFFWLRVPIRFLPS